MTTTPATLRRVALVASSATLFVLAYAGPASADIPDGWSDPPPVPVLRDLLVFIGIPLVITFFIFAFVYLPGIVRGESVAPAGAHADDQWFGGRRDAAELEAAPASSTTEPEEGPGQTGGAGGTW